MGQETDTADAKKTPAAKIGPSFADELAAANLAGLAVAWGDDGRIGYGPEITPAQKSAVEALLAAHDPAKHSPKAQIAALEAQATPRRLREATLGTDGGWLKALDARIAALRAALR